uniref:NADH-ubiquinone oxidoreductase chain 2 n=1 Tax=Bombina bombina TaxID=8345 RepID=A0A411HRD8_BOMBO|nr:NADH dehydrogenase subunit 2 [Bombina bombina]QXL58143.1 NADH dehydrogenase subunit 2 [Bombina bombina]QXL58156.1 NADH dehydrogenase subunit 2 [Bombina bombina]QXL58169.1 NADH dehydrogenase subunit 2 [Bombina bombina]QXL58182.1 NADH dehydrogenase subunit 2 [Bombina bombina]
MSPLVLSILMSSLALGTVITASSHHWLLAWMGLEINTLAIIPLMAKMHHPRAIEAATKYFITQAAASAVILFSSTTNAWTTGEWDIMNLTSHLSTTTLLMAILMKLGVAPFHFWLPEVLQGIDLTTGLILSTWQKLAPMALLIQVSPNLNPQLLFISGIISTMIGGWGGLNQTQLRKIMAYSSIAHLGWMMVALTISPQLTTLNLIIYIIMTTAMFLTLKMLSSTKISTLSSSWQKTPTLAAMSTLTLLSMGGLPPLTGFMPKWLILQEMTKQSATILATMMALSALLSLFFYIRLTYTMTLTTHPNTTPSTQVWRFSTTQPKLLLMASATASVALLPSTPLLLSILP